jgi:ABC-type lipopolysaccharide export system ATPase subunit
MYAITYHTKEEIKPYSHIMGSSPCVGLLGMYGLGQHTLLDISVGLFEVSDNTLYWASLLWGFEQCHGP